MEYRRCQGKSFMIRKTWEQIPKYQVYMIRENVIAGILPMQQVQEGEDIFYWYEISGRHDLEGYAQFHKLGKEFLENFIVSLYRTLQNIGEYLLLEDGISLDPNMIYLNYNEKEIYFCYIPGNEKKLEDSLREFMEYFLKHMEHGEQKDIEVCYDVYEKCQMQHVSLLDLVETVAGNSCSEEKELYHFEQKNILEEPDIPVERREKKKKRFPVKGFHKKKHNRENQVVFEPEEYMEESTNSTVFLGSERKDILGELRYEGDGTGHNFVIDMPAFLIGSQEDEVNGLIRNSSVSRHHAMVYKEEEQYYLEDLNSTNGTYLNGEALNYKERVPLSKNDKIKFADEAYRFV